MGFRREMCTKNIEAKASLITSATFQLCARLSISKVRERRAEKRRLLVVTDPAYSGLRKRARDGSALIASCFRFERRGCEEAAEYEANQTLLEGLYTRTIDVRN